MSRIKSMVVVDMICWVGTGAGVVLWRVESVEVGVGLALALALLAALEVLIIGRVVGPALAQYG